MTQVVPVTHFAFDGTISPLLAGFFSCDPSPISSAIPDTEQPESRPLLCRIFQSHSDHLHLSRCFSCLRLAPKFPKPFNLFISVTISSFVDSTRKLPIAEEAILQQSDIEAMKLQFGRKYMFGSDGWPLNITVSFILTLARRFSPTVIAPFGRFCLRRIDWSGNKTSLGLCTFSTGISDCLPPLLTIATLT